MEKQENKKTVIEMAKQYQELTNEAAKKKIIESCGVKTYLPIRDKLTLITDTVYDRLGQINDDGLAYYSGVDSMIYLILTLTEGYTDLQMGDDELEDFDALMSSGLASAILEEIGEDADVYQQMFDLVTKEFLDEHNTISKYVGICASAIMQPIMEFSNAITSFVNDNGGLDNLLGQLEVMQQDLTELNK